MKKAAIFEIDTLIELQDETRDLTPDDIVLQPGVKELVSSLNEKKVDIAIVCGGDHGNMDPLLEMSPFTEGESILITAEESQDDKPHTCFFLIAEKILGLKPPECVVVASRPSRIREAKKVGIKVVAVQGEGQTKEELKEAGADIVVESLDQISAGEL